MTTPLLIHAATPQTIATAPCGAMIGSVSDGHWHTAHLSMPQSERERYAAGTVAGRQMDVCQICWPA